MNEPLTRDQADKIIAEGEKRYSALLEMRIDQLERELNAANERIKRLEEAGNNLLWNFCPEYTSDLTQEQSDAVKQWNKAKEAKS